MDVLLYAFFLIQLELDVSQLLLRWWFNLFFLHLLTSPVEAMKKIDLYV